MLGETKHDSLQEFMWAMFSGAVGALPGAGQAFYWAFCVSQKDRIPLTGFTTIEIVLFSIFVALGVFSFALVRARYIRNRTKARITTSSPVMTTTPTSNATDGS